MHNTVMLQCDCVYKIMVEQKKIFAVSKYYFKDKNGGSNGAIDVMAHWHGKFHRLKIIIYFRRDCHENFCRIFSPY